MQSYFGSEKVRSDNLYQLFAYLKNFQVMETEGRTVEGILLYPTVAKSLDLEYQVHGHRFRIATLDLGADWKQITQRLLGLLN